MPRKWPSVLLACQADDLLSRNGHKDTRRLQALRDGSSVEHRVREGARRLSRAIRFKGRTEACQNPFGIVDPSPADAERRFPLPHRHARSARELRLLPCVFAGTKKMQRYVGLVAQHPAVMAWRDVEEVSRIQLFYRSPVHCRRGASGDDEPDVLHIAAPLPLSRPDMSRPLPSRLVGSPAYCHATNPHDLEPSLLEETHLVGMLESLQIYWNQGLCLRNE